MRLAKILTPLILGLVLVLAACAAPALPAPTAPASTPAATPAPATTPSPTATPAPPPTVADNFRLLISDAPNAIGDFSSLKVSIDHIGVLRSGEGARWLQFMPDEEEAEVDLTLLVGENAQEVWSGYIPEGTYAKVFIYVDSVSGVLQDGSQVEVKLPSNKLHLSRPFEVTAEEPVSFVFDISVVAAGNPRARGGVRYILLPQIGQSGPDKEFREVKGERPEKPARRLRLSLGGDLQTGGSVTLLVTHQRGGPAEGAQVTVNGQEASTTDSEGRLELTLPPAGEVEIEATLGEAEGKLKIRLEGAEAEAQEFVGTITAITEGGENLSPWTMEIEGVEGPVTVIVTELEGTPEVGKTARVEGVLHDGVIANAEAEVAE